MIKMSCIELIDQIFFAFFFPMGEWRVRVCSNPDSIFWKQLEKTLGGIYIIRADNTAKDRFVSGSWLSQIRKLLDSSLTLIAREMFWEASEGLVVVNGATETSLETQESDLPSLNSIGSVGPVFIYRVRIITWLLQDNYGRSPTRGESYERRILSSIMASQSLKHGWLHN